MSEDITPATDETIVALARLAEHDIPIASGDVLALIARIRQAERSWNNAARTALENKDRAEKAWAEAARLRGVIERIEDAGEGA